MVAGAVDEGKWDPREKENFKVDYTKEGQNDIYYNTGEGNELAISLSYLKKLQKEDIKTEDEKEKKKLEELNLKFEHWIRNVSKLSIDNLKKGIQTIIDGSQEIKSNMITNWHERIIRQCIAKIEKKKE